MAVLSIGHGVGMSSDGGFGKDGGIGDGGGDGGGGDIREC